MFTAAGMKGGIREATPAAPACASRAPEARSTEQDAAGHPEASGKTHRHDGAGKCK